MILAGDFVPQGLTPLCEDLPEDEIVLANLEGPICDDGLKRATKVGISLHSKPFPVKGKWAFSLANNHLMDFGEQGRIQTEEFLKKNGCSFAGAGHDESSARKPMILEEHGVKVAVLSCCERQFGIANDRQSGCAEKGLWLLDEVKRVKEKKIADYVIVSCHAASEFSPFISPRLRDFYHRLINSGCDVIHGHHAHVPQGWETYDKSLIFYGLGNFVVDAEAWNGGNRDWSNVAHLRFDANGVSLISIKPYSVSRENGYVKTRRIMGGRCVQCAKYTEAVLCQLHDNALCESVWQEVCIILYHRIYEQLLRAASTEVVRLTLRDRMRKAYFACCDLIRAGIGWEHVTNKSLFYARCMYNYFNCESHVDMISTALGVLTGGIADRRTEESRRIVMEALS